MMSKHADKLLSKHVSKHVSKHHVADKLPFGALRPPPLPRTRVCVCLGLVLFVCFHLIHNIQYCMYSKSCAQLPNKGLT